MSAHVVFKYKTRQMVSDLEIKMMTRMMMMIIFAFFVKWFIPFSVDLQL
jgi:hypothetical protein